MKKASFFSQNDNLSVNCKLCPQNCVIPNHEAGFCQIRYNKEGILYTENYEQVSSISIDPIEKKPLYHFLPESDILSVGTFLCNLQCNFCQNWSISQKKVHTQTYTSINLLNYLKENENLKSIAYTYNEPVIWYEFVYDTAKLLHENGYLNVMVTNGFINQKPLEELLPFIDAFNVDLKAYNNDFYKTQCSGRLQPVLNSIETIFKSGKIIEITNLLIPGLNDSNEDITNLVDFIYNLSPDIPLHFSRYHPEFKCNIAPTNINSLKRAYNLAKEKLNNVYAGNTNNEELNSSFCSKCGEMNVKRRGYLTENYLDKNKCNNCKNEVYGYF